MQEIILKVQKGFIKGTFILDVVISLWEGVEHDIDFGQDFFEADFSEPIFLALLYTVGTFRGRMRASYR